MNNRDYNMAAALVAPEGGRRSLSAGSLLVLEMLGNPLAGLDAGLPGRVSRYALAEFAWVHEAPRERVQSAAVVARANPEGLRAVVLEWAEGQEVGAVAEWEFFAREQVERAVSCMAVHERGGESKNGLGPCLS